MSGIVEIVQRPRRIAFVVDVDQSSGELFDTIFQFNASVWGGRHNPIVPIVNGSIAPSYWELLRLTDPDVVYSYAELDDAVMAEIQTELCPMAVIEHRKTMAERNYFTPDIDGQATILPVLKTAVEQLPMFSRLPAPAILTFDYNDSRALTPFAKRNFGSNTQTHIWCRDNDIPQSLLPADDPQTLRALASNRNLILPLEVSSHAPISNYAWTEELDTALTIFFGDSLWSCLEFWNNAQFRSGTYGFGAVRELWLDDSHIQEDGFYSALVEFIRRRVHASDQQRRVRMCSFQHDHDQLREITQKLCHDLKWNFFPGSPVERLKGEFPKFVKRNTISFSLPQEVKRQSEQMLGQRSLIRFRPILNIGRQRNQHWIAEFAIENPHQEKYFSNKPAWWQLPRKHGITQLFSNGLPSRVDATHSVSVQISAENPEVILSTPDEFTFFSQLILPPDPHWKRTQKPRQYYARPSDKGMYIRGVLGLFESLKKAAYVFEHPFWRSLVDSLSSPRASEQIRRKVRTGLLSAGIEKLDLDQMVDQVLDTAGRMQRPTSYVSFESLFQNYLKYVREIKDENERFQEVTELAARDTPLNDERDFKDAAKKNLRTLLSQLTARKFFFQGAEVQCPHCLASLWYHVDDLRATLICRGCRSEVALPAEVSWSYSLNDLVSSAVRDHGVGAVIRTLYRLFEGSRNSFAFVAGIEIRNYSTTTEKQICEFDLVWIKDGEFGVAEVKRTAKKFETSKKVVSILDNCLPDRYLLVSTSGTAEELKSFSQECQSRLSGRIKVEHWDPDVFSRSPHIGWNSSVYSVFG